MKSTIMQELEGKLHHMEFLTKPVYTQQDINSAISTTAKKCFEEIETIRKLGAFMDGTKYETFVRTDCAHSTFRRGKKKNEYICTGFQMV